MEEMEVRTEDLEDVETNDKEADGSSGIGVGLAMLIGSGLTLAAIAGGKKLINLWADHKAKKDQMEVDVEIIEDSEDDETDFSDDETERKEN